MDVITSTLCLGALKGSTDQVESTSVVAAIEIINNDESQDLVFDPIKNTNPNNPLYSGDDVDAGFLLKTKQVQRRLLQLQNVLSVSLLQLLKNVQYLKYCNM